MVVATSPVAAGAVMTMISSVAVIQTAFVGDVLLTMPLMKALRIALPDVVLSLVTTPAGADVISGVDFIDRVHAFDKRGDHRSTSECAVWHNSSDLLMPLSCLIKASAH
jgi:ADP-heptose:LPS heptosyltransferase